MSNALRTKLSVARMPVLVAAICASSLCSVGVLVVMSGGTRALGLEPDYYRKALDWDHDKAAREHSAALEWSAELEIDPKRSAVVVHLLDASGAAVEGAAVTGEAFAYRDAAARETLRFDGVDGQPGTYGTTLRAGVAAGKWRVSLVAVHGKDRFIFERDIEVSEP